MISIQRNWEVGVAGPPEQYHSTPLLVWASLFNSEKHRDNHVYPTALLSHRTANLQLFQILFGTSWTNVGLNVSTLQSAKHTKDSFNNLCNTLPQLCPLTSKCSLTLLIPIKLVLLLRSYDIWLSGKRKIDLRARPHAHGGSWW